MEVQQLLQEQDGLQGETKAEVRVTAVSGGAVEGDLGRC